MVRKEVKTHDLSDDDKFQQDVTFLKELGKKSGSLTGFSLYMWWFPPEIQEVLEMLMVRKPLDGDVGGLLALIMFAGIDFDDDDFFRNASDSESVSTKHQRRSKQFSFRISTESIGFVIRTHCGRCT